MTNLFRALRTGVLLSFCFPCFAAGQMIYVDRVDPQYVVEPLVKNDRGAAQSNTKRIAAIMQRAPQGATLFFPGGDYYFAGSAAPNRGTIESTATGQVFRGEGAGTTRIFQTDARRDFGFVCREDLKRVPAATIRIRHKGCVIDGMTVALDRQTPSKTIAGTAAIQIAHIAYHPDNNVGIIETTGRGADFLLDHVIVSRVNVGEQLGSGILSDKFFEVGIDIIGSGGHVRVSDVNRLDARTGIRLDNGNHCGQGEYQFESIYCMGNPAVFRDGVFFDWVGGQAPSIHNSSCSFTSGIFAGPQVRRPAESVSGSRSGQTAGARLGLADAARPLGRRRSESGAAYRVVRTAALCRSGADRQRTGRRRPRVGCGQRFRRGTGRGRRLRRGLADRLERRRPTGCRQRLLRDIPPAGRIPGA